MEIFPDEYLLYAFFYAGNLTVRGEIKSIDGTAQQKIFSTNTAPVLLGGSGGAYIGKTTAFPNTYLEIVPQGYNSILDFHCSTINNDFDARIVAAAGGAGDGTALMGFISGSFDVSANLYMLINTPKVDCNTTNYVNFSSPTTFLKQTTANIISSSTLNMSAPTININTKQFRFVPWTTFYSGTTLATNVINYPTGASAPTANAGATLKYRYSVIGNTMYINYSFYQVSGGTAGSGVYQYAIPGGYTLNTTDIVYSPTTGNPTGTKVGTAGFIFIGSNNALGNAYITNQGGTNGLMFWQEAGPNWGPNGSTYYHYGTSNLVIHFEAMIPIN